MKAVVLYRKSVMEADELEAAKSRFECVDSILDVPERAIVVARYSVLPFYAEVERDIKKRKAKLLNTHNQHLFIADLGNYTELLGELTPRTYTLENTPESGGPFVVKGETNSKRNLWKTHMYATNKREAVQVACRLMEDTQKIYVRDFIPLETFGVGLDGVPISREFRFFVLDGKVLCGAYYWANQTDVLQEQGIAVPSASEVPQEFLQKVTGAIGDSVRFYVVDVAKTANGEWIVIELNDGQQSGLSENSPDTLYKALYFGLRGAKDVCEKCCCTLYHHCPKCGSCPDDHWVHRDLDHGMVGLDGDVLCRKCGEYVRFFDV